MISPLFSEETEDATPLSRVLGAATRILTLVLVFLLPLFFLPWTLDVAEFNKQLLLLTVASLAGLAWLGKMLLERRFEYRRSFLNVFVLLILVSSLLSTLFSESRYVSLVGDAGQEMEGFITLLGLVIMYFVAANTFRGVQALKQLLFATVGGGFFVALFAVLQGLHVYVFPFVFAQTSSFNAIGTPAALGVYLACIVTLCGGLLMLEHSEQNDIKGIAKKVALAATAALSLFVVAVIDFNPVTVSLLCGSAVLLVCAFVHANSTKGVTKVLLPIIALAISVLLFFFRVPAILESVAEVMPSMKTSVGIVQETLREHPFLGSGPGTFIFDYAKFHPVSVNQSDFWSVRFDRAASHFLTSFATTGFFGALVWILFALSLFFVVAKKVLRSEDENHHLLFGVFAAWTVLLVARCVYSSTVTLEFMFWLMTAALFVAYQKEQVSKRFDESPQAAMLITLLFIVGLVFACAGVFVAGERYAAEISYAKANTLSRENGDPSAVVLELTHAITLNRYNSVYARNLALAYLMKVNAEAAAAPNLVPKKDEKKEDFAARVDYARQATLKVITADAASAIDAAKAATDLDPNNVVTWSVLASTYQSLIGVTDNADDWALKSFQSALALEPNNPETHTNVGKVYLYQSDHQKQLADGIKDKQAKTDADKKVSDLLDQAADEFNKAIALKPDYAVAHYNLAIVYDREGKLKDSITKMESIIVHNGTDVGLGFQLALLYYRDGRKDDAVRLLESVVKLTPNYSNARWYLAAMYEEKGNIDGALSQIVKVQELNPGNTLVAQKLQDLQKKKPWASLPPPVEQSAPIVPPPPAPVKK